MIKLFMFLDVQRLAHPLNFIDAHSVKNHWATDCGYRGLHL